MKPSAAPPANAQKPAAMEQVAAIVEEIRAVCPPDSRIVFVSGNFNIVHPGHLRLLNFAAQCGDFLVVGVNADGADGALLPQDLRLKSIRSIGVVNHAFILRLPPEAFIARLQPAIVVKGKEHETGDNHEQPIIDAYGGKLLFSSGDVRFSSMDLLRKEFYQTDFSTITKPLDFPARHSFSFDDLVNLVGRFAGIRVTVIGDLIVDEYINCDALGMSREDPTLVVTPIKHDRFVGGAGIVAAHAAGLGAEVRYFGVVGDDEAARFAAETLAKYDVRAEFITDESRPTTLKQRYRANNKTLLRVSHLRQHDIGGAVAREFLDRVAPALADADLVVFSDFNYGCLPQPIVDVLVGECTRLGVMLVADSQTSSQIGDVSRFAGALLLTPTEHEARLAVRDFQSGLVVLAEKLRQKANAHHVLITLGAEGVLVHAPSADGNLVTDRIPALNTSPKDPAGAGDSLLICAALALTAGADIWSSAYLSSLAAACQVSRVGNTPLTAGELLTELTL